MNMSPSDFRRYGHEVVDWIADYMAHIRDYRVLPETEPGELINRLPSSAPETGEPMEKVLEDFRQLIVPAVTHWNHPRFFAYFAITGSGPGILAEMLTAALNVNGMLWKSCPAATELEEVVLGWLRQWLGLPDDFFGIIYDTASVSSLHAIAAAREMADPESRLRGVGWPLTLYTSEQAHSSIEKGAITLGIGQRNVRKIAVDAEFRMRPDALEEAIIKDQAEGKKPFCIVATVGTTSTTSIDPVPAIADVAQRHRLWLHVDAAYGGAAAAAPEYRHVLSGADRADSLVVNPHKWLFTPIDLSAFYTRRPEILRHAFSLVPEYLRTAEDSRACNYMDYGVQLGRRFRSLKLWFVMRYFGRHGVAATIRSHIQWAQEFAGWVRSDPSFEVVAPTPFSLVCFRYQGSDEDNRRLLESINTAGRAFLSHTVLHGHFVLRLAIGNLGTTKEDLEQVWEALRTEAGRL
jgi:aromatic-L-amino-acid decarboxylase